MTKGDWWARAVTVGLITAISLALVLVLLTLLRPAYAPLGVYSIAIIDTTTRDSKGIALVSLTQDKSISIHLTKCNNSSEDIPVAVSIQWESVDTVTTNVIPVADRTEIRQKGCRNTNTLIPVPSGLTVGTWKIVGSSTATRGTQSQTVTWESERFKVIP